VLLPDEENNQTVEDLRRLIAEEQREYQKAIKAVGQGAFQLTAGEPLDI
jgi:hypothetical protein